MPISLAPNDGHLTQSVHRLGLIAESYQHRIASADIDDPGVAQVSRNSYDTFKPRALQICPMCLRNCSSAIADKMRGHHSGIDANSADREVYFFYQSS